MASASFTPGTNFSAWVHRIMINHFISHVRRTRESATDIEQMREMAVAASQQNVTDLREVSRAFHRLPEDQKHALRSVAIDEKSYEQISGESGVAVGTLKSRVHRARLQLQMEMAGTARIAA
jgi:RNA polymerase sigma-70 factor, ECF subfamily